MSVEWEEMTRRFTAVVEAPHCQEETYVVLLAKCT